MKNSKKIAVIEPFAASNFQLNELSNQLQITVNKKAISRTAK